METGNAVHVVLSLLMKSFGVTIQMKPLGQYFCKQTNKLLASHCKQPYRSGGNIYLTYK